MKETTKKFIYLKLDNIKQDLKLSRISSDAAINECYKLRGIIQYMKYNNDITRKEYDKLNKFTLGLLTLTTEKCKH